MASTNNTEDWKTNCAREVDALPSRLKTILNSAILNDFYPKVILPTLLLIAEEEKHSKPPPISTKYILKAWGYIIYTCSDERCPFSTVFIMFVFINPEWRRKGHFQRAIDNFKKTADIIVLTSSNENMGMFWCCKKNDIEPLAMTRSDDEIFYGWSEKYDGEFILKNVY